MNNLVFAFGVTALAGLATGIGSTIGFFAKKTNTKFLSVSLGFSAGVMIYVSMVEIYAKARGELTAELGIRAGSWATVLAFFGGMAVIALIDRLIPRHENPHEAHRVEELCEGSCPPRDKLLRMGLFTALAVGIHNFPEGIATFITALQEPTLALPIAFAIAIHNIPEGIAVSVPVYYATGDRRKAFLYSFLSGLSEPIGALLGYLVLLPIMGKTVFGILFAAVAGIMVFISLDELLPTAREYGEHHLAIYGLVAGMVVMAVSLLLFL